MHAWSLKQSCVNNEKATVLSGTYVYTLCSLLLNLFLQNAQQTLCTAHTTHSNK